MRINTINATNHMPNFKAVKYTGNITPAFRTDLSRGEKISICAVSSAVLGLTVASMAIIKKSGKTPIKFLKRQKNLLLNKLQKSHHKQDPVVKMLKGRRDASAVKDYQIYMAKKKIASLDKKVLNNQINMTPEAHKHIVKNKIALERITGNVTPLSERYR